MTYVRSYVMSAKPDSIDALKTVLITLHEAVLELPGSKGVDLMQDLDQPETFHFVERWESRAAHAAAGKLLPPGLTDQLKSCLGAAPRSQNLETVA